MNKKLFFIGNLAYIILLSSIFSTQATAQTLSYSYRTNDPLIFGVTSFVYLLCCCIFAIPWLFICFWIYKDAKKNNIENPILWALLAFFTSIIGILIYLLAVRPDAIKKNSNSSNNSNF